MMATPGQLFIFLVTSHLATPFPFFTRPQLLTRV
jgi:hypothetical protein